MACEADAAATKRREAQIRRYAAEMGYAVRKSRARDPERMDFGRYRIEDVKNDCIVAGRFPYGYALSLDDVEDVLEELWANREQDAIEAELKAARAASGRITFKGDT